MNEKSELYGGSPDPYSKSIFACVKNGFSRNPAKLAVVSRTQRGDHLIEAVLNATSLLPESTRDTCLRWSYAELLGVAANLAEGLAQKIADPDSVIITFVPNSVEWLLIVLASTLAKIGIACLDIDMLQRSRQAELEARILQLRPSCIIVANRIGASAVDDVLQEKSLGDTLKVTLNHDESTEAIDNGWTRFPSLCKPRSSSVITERLNQALDDDTDRTAMVLYTSGTSGGMPKACIRHVGSIVASVTAQNFTPSDDNTKSVRILQTANFRTIAPMVALGALRDGATIVLTEYPFNPEAFLNDVEQELVTECALIPAQIHALAAAPSFASRNLSSLKVVASGGDIVTSALVEFTERCFTRASFMTAHGMTELGGIFQWPYWNSSASIPFHQGISPLGHPSPGVRLRLVGEYDRIVPRGEVGELHIQHASVFQTYLRKYGEMPEFYTDETGKWFKTGDLALFSRSGDVYIVGRSKDVIKRAAVSIAPAAIESCLQSYTGSQTVVIGKAHPTLGQEPFAIAQSFNGKKAEDLATHVKEMFGADWQLGGAVELKSLGLGSFPLNATGKIQKSELAGPFAEYLAAAA